jgi:hypothetical protein
MGSGWHPIPTFFLDVCNQGGQSNYERDRGAGTESRRQLFLARKESISTGRGTAWISPVRGLRQIE